MNGPAAESPLRLALVTGQLGFGGAERQLTELALRCRQHGNDVTVFCLGGDDTAFGPVLRHDGIHVVQLTRRAGFDVGRVAALTSHFREDRFDLVHSFLIDSNPYVFLASRLAGRQPFVASNRNVDFRRGSVRRTVDSLVFRRADAIVVNAEAVRDFTSRCFGVPRTRCRVVYNGVNLKRFSPGERADSDFLRVGTIGSLTEKKNPELFAGLARRLKDHDRNIEFVHAGDGPLRAGLERRHGDAVTYRGNLSAAEEFLRGLDVFVLTSDREGCPNVVLEALATGLPVVATDAGGTGEVLRDGVEGFIVRRGDLESLASRTGQLLEDAPLRDQFGLAGRHRVEDRFSMEHMVQRMLELYRTLLTASR